MVNQTKAIRAIGATLLPLLILLGLTGAAWSQPCRTYADVLESVGAKCTEDPSCVVVGETHVLEWKSSAPAKIIVVCIHGLGLCAKAYKPLAQELSAAGIDGFGVNVRGFGPDRDKPNRGKLNCIETVSDVRKLLANIQQEYPDYKVFLIGESMGGALAIRIAAENPELVDGIVCSAPAWKILKKRRTAVKGIFELILFPGKSPGPAGKGLMHQATSSPELTEHWLADPSHKLKLTFTEATSFLSFISKTETYSRKLTKPVLIIQGLNDRLVSPEAVAKIVREIPSDNKTFLIDGNGEHLVLEEGRFSRPVIERVISWLKMDTKERGARALTEVLNDQTLSPPEEKRLETLRRLSQGRGVID
jgi:alpha-beta hydrolase superfamily lysophospholipase